MAFWKKPMFQPRVSGTLAKDLGALWCTVLRSGLATRRGSVGLIVKGCRQLKDMFM